MTLAMERVVKESRLLMCFSLSLPPSSSLPLSPPSSPQVGGVQSVTLGDEEARTRGTQKSVLERTAPPTFPVLIEMRERHFWVAHQVGKDRADALAGVECFDSQAGADSSSA